MPLEIPKIDDLSYRQILENALERVKVHTPEWTNLRESDPGVVMLELFAFMTESMLYRSNQIPERNRLKFLNLLGVPLRPATPATGLATFTNDTNTAVAVTGDLRVVAGSVPFRTAAGLDVLPVTALVCYKQALTGKALQAAQQEYARRNPTAPAVQNLRFYETVHLPAPTDAVVPSVDLRTGPTDSALWVALQAGKAAKPADIRGEIAGKMLNLGVLPAAPDDTRHLLPLGSPAATQTDALEFSLFTPAADGQWRYTRLSPILDTNVLLDAGVVSLLLPEVDARQQGSPSRPAAPSEQPPQLDPKLAQQVVGWVRVQLRRGSSVAARLSWLGINAVRVHQREEIAAVLQKRGSGEPEQIFQLPMPNVLAGSTTVWVNNEAWEEIDDLLAAGPELEVRDTSVRPGVPRESRRPTKVFAVDAASGELRFGDGLRGTRPPREAHIRVRYTYGGGRAGNVGLGSLNKATLPAGLKVSNPLPTWGGTDAETTADAERRIAQYLRHRDRMVTAEDFREIVLATPGAGIGRVEVLSLFHPAAPQERSPGVVTLMVVPDAIREQKKPPEPDRALLELVAMQVEPRRLITTELYVRPPVYKPVQIAVRFEVAVGYDAPSVRIAILAALRTALSPLVGGHDGKGWPLRKAVVAKELHTIVDRVAGVEYVAELELRGADPASQPVESIPLEGLELPWLSEAEATHVGAPPPDGPDDGDGGGAVFLPYPPPPAPPSAPPGPQQPPEPQPQPAPPPSPEEKLPPAMADGIKLPKKLPDGFC